jgi:hypothetical protein
MVVIIRVVVWMIKRVCQALATVSQADKGK